MSKLGRCDDCGKLAYDGETVTLGAAEYEALRKAASEAASRTQISAYRAVSSSRIARNPKMADFILACAVTMTIAEIAKACQDRFGTSSPSRSSIYRFIQAMKRYR